METAAALLFAVLILLGAVCAFFLVVAQPIWGIVDVATSDKHSGGTKTAIILLTLLLLGPIMTVFYACCGTCSNALRRAILIASGALAFAGVSALAMALAMPAAKNSTRTIILPIQCQLKFPVAPAYLFVVFQCFIHCL